MSEPVNILLVEDDEDDYLITREVLEDIQDDRYNLEWVQDYETGLAHLMRNQVSVCLVDYRIGARTGLEFLKVTKEKGITSPVILLTGVGQRDVDIAATEAGAADFLDKSSLTPELMERSIRYAIAHAKALDALAEQSSFLSTTLEYSGACIAALDDERRLRTCNRRFEDLLQSFIQELDSCPPGDRACAIRSMAAQLREAPDHEIEFTDPNGRVFEIRKNPTPHGGVVIFAVDVTDQKAVEANLINSKLEVEAASRAKSSFLANMSHEFRTPLHGIMGFSDLILQVGEQDDIKEFAGQIRDSSVHLLEIINTVLAYSRLEAGQHPFESSELLEVDCLVEFCIKQVLPAATARNISVTEQIDDRLLSLNCDTTAVRRILINLLSNAVRFSNEDGEVEVDLTIAADGCLKIAVSDHGIGMHPDQVEKAFLPFHQIGGGYDRQCDGTGLGLPMVKSLAALHDADVSIETELDVGTCVTVVFPSERVGLKQSDKKPAVA